MSILQIINYLQEGTCIPISNTEVILWFMNHFSPELYLSCEFKLQSRFKRCLIELLTHKQSDKVHNHIIEILRLMSLVDEDITRETTSEYIYSFTQLMTIYNQELENLRNQYILLFN